MASVRAVHRRESSDYVYSKVEGESLDEKPRSPALPTSRLARAPKKWLTLFAVVLFCLLPSGYFWQKRARPPSFLARKAACASVSPLCLASLDWSGQTMLLVRPSCSLVDTVKANEDFCVLVVVRSLSIPVDRDSNDSTAT